MIGPVERRLVTDFAELRAGMPVVVVRCGHCGREHPGILVQFQSRARTRYSSGSVVVQDAFDLTPGPSCGGLCVAPTTVRARTVFRIVDPDLEAPEQYAEDLEVVAVEAAERARRVPARERSR